MPAACIGAAALHAAYKVSLFSLPSVDVRANLLALGVGTFVVGVVFGLLREIPGSIICPILAHGTFDAIAYLDVSHVPWWVG